MDSSHQTELPNRRRDIQGLRALAVLGVIAFHAGLPVSGGFAGVDVFFVISGYVITNMLRREWDNTGSIRIRSFFRRRFLRLTPALALLIAFTFLISGFVLYADQQWIAMQTGFGALFLVANLVIARNTGGYFDSPAEMNPLLNTWSLSVEEQFYILFPVVILLGFLVSRRFPRLRSFNLFAVFLLGFVSFASMMLSTGLVAGLAVPSWLNFYSPIPRVWEFAVGSALAFGAHRFIRIPQFFAYALVSCGLLSILVSFFAFNEVTPWPSIWTLLPTMGATLVLLGGQGSLGNHGTPLSAGAAVRIGDWSYSLYLWHWPLIVFAIALGFREPWMLALVALFSFLPAIFSYKFVEQPLRARGPRKSTRSRWIIAVIVLSPFFIAGLLFTALRPTVEYPGAVGIGYLNFIERNSFPCEGDLAGSSVARCRQSIAGLPPEVVVVGDSHAEHLFPGLLTEFPDVNIQYIFMPGWPYGSPDEYSKVMDQIAQSPNVRTIVLGSRWKPEIVGAEDYLTTLISDFTTTGKLVVINNDNPFFTHHARECKYERPVFSDNGCTEGSAEFLSLESVVEPVLRNLALMNSKVILVDTAQDFCDDETCSMVIDGQLLIADYGHLNVNGSTYVIARLKNTNIDFAVAIEGTVE